ncbi:hypothetical protein [Carnobacterium maltaromaticum]|nr:hypothetical protein [Carnobacterium maltaromaticum]
MKYVIWLLVITVIPYYFNKSKGGFSILGIMIAIVLGTLVLEYL